MQKRISAAVTYPSPLQSHGQCTVGVRVGVETGVFVGTPGRNVSVGVGVCVGVGVMVGVRVGVLPTMVTEPSMVEPK